MAPNNALKLTGKPIFLEHVSHENNTVDNTSILLNIHLLERWLEYTQMS